MDSFATLLQRNGMIFPDLKRSNFEIFRQLEAKKSGDMIGEKEKKIVFIIDGMGWNLLQLALKSYPDILEHNPYMKISKIHTIFPSTTMNVLPSLYSAMPTAQHGVVGTKLFMQQYGMTVNSIKMIPAGLNGQYGNIKPELIFPRGRVVDTLKQKGERVSILSQEGLVNSAMTRATFDTEDIIPVIGFEDMLVKARRLVKQNGPEYIFGYNELLDHAEHTYNYREEEPLELLLSMLRSLDSILLRHIKGSNYNLIITSDHGHIIVRANDLIKIDHSHTMMEYLSMPPWGEGRAAFVDVKIKRKEEFEAYMKRKFSNSILVVDSDYAIKSGIFGAKAIKDNIRYRFGTHILIPKGNKHIHYIYPTSQYDTKVSAKLGVHGGLSTDEIEIPLILI